MQPNVTGPSRKSVLVAYHGHCFDGAISAAVLTEAVHRELGQDATCAYLPRAYVDPRPLPAHGFSASAVVDFRWTPDPALAWWFDHHETSFSDGPDGYAQRAEYEIRKGERPGRFACDPSAPSCAGLIARALGVAGPQWEELVHWADLCDTASYESADQALDTDLPALRVRLYLKHARPGEQSSVIAALRAEGLGGCAREIAATERFAAMRRRQLQADSDAEKACELRGSVAFADGAGGRHGFSRYAPYRRFPEALFSVQTWSGPEKFGVSLGANPWARGKAPGIDLSAVASRHGGGGHRDAAGLSKDTLVECRAAALACLQEINRRCRDRS